MGQAKRRGTFEERLAQAEARKVPKRNPHPIDSKVLMADHRPSVNSRLLVAALMTSALFKVRK